MSTLVSNKTGLPLPEVTADEPGGFGLGLGRFYRKELGGAYWFYEGETLGFRTIFAYWPQDDLLITGSVNSRPPNGEDKFGPTVIGGAFMALQQEGALLNPPQNNYNGQLKTARLRAARQGGADDLPAIVRQRLEHL